MIIDALLLLLFMSFIVHILILIFYFLNKTQKLFIWFISTTFSNIIIGIILSIFILKEPEKIRNMDFSVILWILSGFLSLLMLCVKIYFIRKIIKRRNNPESYHINHFGKRVYEVGIVKNYELAVLILSMPIFLIFGAYFLAKLKTMSF